MEVNYLAVVAAAAVNMAVGMLWYGPLFGKQWMGLMGFTPASMKSMKLTAGQAIAGGAVVSLITAYVLARFVLELQVMDAAGAVVLAAWIWLGFTAATLANSFLWEGKPAKLFTLNAGSSLVSLCLMSLVISLWQ